MSYYLHFSNVPCKTVKVPQSFLLSMFAGFIRWHEDQGRNTL